MDYYYALGGQQNGPVGEQQLEQLVTSGAVPGDVLVWTEGMENWVPYPTMRNPQTALPPVAIAVPPAANLVVCSVCKQMFAPDQVIRYGNSFVCGNCKPHFVQTLREGGTGLTGLNYATFGKRFLAKIIDVVLVYVI